VLAFPVVVSRNISLTVATGYFVEYIETTKDSSVMRAARRCALSPRPGKSRGQLDTMTSSVLSWAMAGAAIAAPAPATALVLV